MFGKRRQSMMMVVTFDMVRTDQFPIESVKIDVVMHNSLTIMLLASEKMLVQNAKHLIIHAYQHTTSKLKYKQPCACSIWAMHLSLYNSKW